MVKVIPPKSYKVDKPIEKSKNWPAVEEVSPSVESPILSEIPQVKETPPAGEARLSESSEARYHESIFQPDPTGLEIADSIAPAVPNNCILTGFIEKSPRFGKVLYKASEESHQKHEKDYTCKDVIFMEKEFGRHAENCIHVGYWTNKACGCNK